YNRWGKDVRICFNCPIVKLRNEVDCELSGHRTKRIRWLMVHSDLRKLPLHPLPLHSLRPMSRLMILRHPRRRLHHLQHQLLRRRRRLHPRHQLLHLHLHLHLQRPQRLQHHLQRHPRLPHRLLLLLSGHAWCCLGFSF
ncbi:hypothetical protein BD410DRAFT_847566, partial [Rickenella mellea]